MSDTTTGTAAGQEPNTETDRISAEPTDSQGSGKEQSSNSQAQQPNTTNNNANTQNNNPNQTDARIKELSREAGNYRTQLKDVTTQLETEKASRSQVEAERDALRNELREIKVGGTIRDIVSQAQPVAIEPVLAIIGKDFKIDGRTGQVDADAISAAVTEAQTKYPFLFRGAALGGDAGAGSGSPNSVDMNRVLRQAAGF